MKKVRHLYLALPTRTYGRRDRNARLKLLTDVCVDTGIARPNANVIAIAPARIDFRWKGQDRLLKAISALGPSDIHVIFSGWGADYAAAKQMATDLGIDDRVTFLSACLSKARLYRFMSSVDLVIDQFLFGLYGTTSVEAMTRGCPVMVGINEANFRDAGRALPPVINAHSIRDIEESLQAAIEGRTDLEKIGQECLRYAEKFHGASKLIDNLLTCLRIEKGEIARC
jgi:glycosyltransferase involved in cell wall biosynthesis